MNRVAGPPFYKELKGEGLVSAQATEAWTYARSRSSSAIDDIFTGQLQSTLQCLICGACSHAFDDLSSAHCHTVLQLMLIVDKQSQEHRALLCCWRAQSDAVMCSASCTKGMHPIKILVQVLDACNTTMQSSAATSLSQRDDRHEGHLTCNIALHRCRAAFACKVTT